MGIENNGGRAPAHWRVKEVHHYGIEGWSCRFCGEPNLAQREVCLSCRNRGDLAPVRQIAAPIDAEASEQIVILPVDQYSIQ